MKKIISIFAVIIVVCAAFFNRVRIVTIYDDWRAPELPEAISYYRHPEQSEVRETDEAKPRDLVDAEASSDIHVDPSASGVPFAQDDGFILPPKYNLAVPFASQAPYANWDLPYQESCEEASLIMAHAFFNNRALSADIMDDEIKKLVDWETETFGYYEDTTAQEVALMAQGYFGLSAQIVREPTVGAIKKYLSQNKLVLVPAAGRMLPNPYFSGDGPLYHMLLIRGYTSNRKFITNDPGTKRGEAFLYAYDDLLNAVHDWPREHGGYGDSVTDEEMENGEQVLIVVDK